MRYNPTSCGGHRKERKCALIVFPINKPFSDFEEKKTRHGTVLSVMLNDERGAGVTLEIRVTKKSNSQLVEYTGMLHSVHLDNPDSETLWDELAMITTSRVLSVRVNPSELQIQILG